MKAVARISDSAAAGSPAPTYDNLPDFPALARLKRDRKWVAWKYVQREGKPKPDKLPVNPYSSGNAMVDTPTTWGTYNQAVTRARRDNLPGVAYVLTDDDNLTGIDLDDVRNAETGKLTPWAAEIAELAESYTEVSPSGTDLRIFSEGKIDAPIVSNPLSVEIYRNGRYLTITGQHLEGTPTDILPAPKTLAALRARVNGKNAEPLPNSQGNGKDESLWQKLNTAALQNLSAWVPALFGNKAVSKKGCYRVSSKALGRNLQEALSITPKGIKDFGVHDMGDPRKGKRSPIDVVMEHGGNGFQEAVDWLREKLGGDKNSKSIQATPFVWIDPSKIPPRQWLYKPHYIRQFVSATFSPGGLGKTSLLTVEVLAMAANKKLLGIQPSQQVRVWYWNGEDPMQELQRRFAAACKYHGVTKDDIGDHLFIDSGRTMPIVIAEDTRTGTRIAEPVIEEVIATIRERRIDVLIVDPFTAFCEEMSDTEITAFREVAERDPPKHRVSEAVFIAGRGAGKDSVASLIVTCIAVNFDPKGKLRPGEQATILAVACDRDQASILTNYVQAYFEEIAPLRALVKSIDRNGVTLRNGVTIIVATNSFRSVRGRSILACVFDECAFWRDETSANPDLEVAAAVAPGLARVRGSMSILISTVYRRNGLLYERFKEHFGKDSDDVLVVKGSTTQFNPTFDAKIIARQLEEDRQRYAAEYLSEWRDDLSTFISRELLDAAVDCGVVVRPPTAGISYFAFADPSGGAHDSFTLGLAHREKDDAVTLDLLFERKAPFNPSEVTEEIAKLLKSYGCSQVTGDRYAAGWTVEAFQKVGIKYIQSERDRSAIYLDCLPLFTSGRARLIDNALLVAQFAALERRTFSTGKDRVDHGSSGKDDACNSAAGALVLASGKGGFDSSYGWVGGPEPSESGGSSFRHPFPWMQFVNY